MRRRGRKSARGFSLLAVIIILAVLVGGLLAILHDAGAGMKQYGVARSRELVNGAMEFGLKEAMQALQRIDPTVLVTSSANGLPGGTWDIFTDWSRASFVCGPPGPICGTPNAQMGYPPNGPNQNELLVRVGLRLGQRTQPPAGEDVNSSYGYIVEVLIAVSKAGDVPDAAERAVYAVRIPHVVSHSN
jgi:hypothetical protein